MFAYGINRFSHDVTRIHFRLLDTSVLDNGTNPSAIKRVCVVYDIFGIFAEIPVCRGNSVDPKACDLGLHCLPRSDLGEKMFFNIPFMGR